MPRKTKLSEALNDEGYSIVPKEVVPPPQEIPVVSQTAVKTKIKREMSEAQRLNMIRMVEANKIKWEEKRKAKAEVEAQSKSKRKVDDQALIDAGTHIRVKILPKRVYKPRGKPTQEEETEEEEEEEEEKAFQAPPVKPKSRKAPPPSDTDTTETETDGEEYKNQKRVVRREVKKNLKALKKIDEVLEQSSGNPYLAYLTQKWK